MPASELLDALWQAVQRAGELERELRRTAEALAAWQQIAQAACAALDRECAHRVEEGGNDADHDH